MKAKSFLALPILFSIIFIVVLAVTSSSAAGPLAGEKICLDPGHGGSDPGAVNIPFGLHESDINLDVSYALKALFKNAGAEVVMTRSGDEYLTNEDRYTFCNQENATILISVHTNSVTDPTWDGAMALYAPNRSPNLAQAIYDVMYPALRDTAPESVADFRDFGLDNFASGVLFKCDMPAAMMEPLLMSHPGEAELLVTPIFADPQEGVFSDDCPAFDCRRGQIAEAIYMGTLSYFGGQTGAEMHVAGIEMAYQQKRSMNFINSAVTITDNNDQPVSDADVTVEYTLPDGTQQGQTAVSGSDGVAAFTLRTREAGTFTVEVQNVSKTDWAYNPDDNVESSETIVVP